MQRKSPLKSRFSVRLASAVKNSPESLAVLGAPHGLTQPQLSRFCAGCAFGPSIRRRVISLADALGVPADRATVRVKVVNS